MSSNANGSGIEIQTGDVAISNSHISNSENIGIIVYPNIKPQITDCIFENNTRDIQSYFSSTDSTYNNTNAIVYILGSTINQNSLVPNPGNNSFYRLTSDANLADNTLLNISPGVLIDFPDQNVDFIINGTLQAIGTELNPIQFVRLDGDISNYGGNINVTANSSNSIFNFVNIDHLGFNSYALNLSSGTTTIGNVNITNSYLRGLQIAGVSPTVVNSTFQGQNTGIYVNTSGDPTFTNCIILGNTNYGINNTGTGVVDARDCWWGDVSGPFHSTNTGGLGNQVSDNVLFNPTLNEPPNNTIVNLGLVRMLEPNSDCNLTDKTPVVVELANLGNITQSNFDVGIVVNQMDTVVENLSLIHI